MFACTTKTCYVLQAIIRYSYLVSCFPQLRFRGFQFLQKLVGKVSKLLNSFLGFHIKMVEMEWTIMVRIHPSIKNQSIEFTLNRFNYFSKYKSYRVWLTLVCKHDKSYQSICVPMIIIILFGYNVDNSDYTHVFLFTVYST